MLDAEPFVRAIREDQTDNVLLISKELRCRVRGASDFSHRHPAIFIREGIAFAEPREADESIRCARREEKAWRTARCIL